MHWVNLATVVTMVVLFGLTLWSSFTDGWTPDRITVLITTAVVVLWCYVAHQWRREALTLYTLIDNSRHANSVIDNTRHVRTVTSKETK